MCRLPEPRTATNGLRHLALMYRADARQRGDEETVRKIDDFVQYYGWEFADEPLPVGPWTVVTSLQGAFLYAYRAVTPKKPVEGPGFGALAR